MHVNEVIGRTMDAVQDGVVERYAPWMDVTDRLLGPSDEMIVSKVINIWRGRVWNNAIRLVESPGDQRASVSQDITEGSMVRADLILGRNLLSALDELF